MLDKTRPYGRLELLDSFINKDKGHARFWNCKCSCGNLKTIREDAIRLGKTESCGCLWKDTVWTGCGELTGEYFGRCKYGAKIRNISFELSVEDAWALFVKQNRKCLLTGRELIFVKDYKHDSAIQTASLDRIDSNGCYELNNVCWLHKEINLFKGNMHSNDFIKMCNEVSKIHCIT